MYLLKNCFYVWIALLCFASLAIYTSTETAFIGWQGATYDPVRTWGPGAAYKHAASLKETDKVNPFDSIDEKDSTEQRWVEQLSWKPRSYLFHNFLSDSECEHLIKLARPLLKRSTVVGDTGFEVNSIRTSLGMFIPRIIDKTVETIQRKIAHWTHLPIENQEDMQILRYGYNQKYGAHMDVLEEDTPRVATILAYLSDVEEGGETSFPNSWNWIDPEQPDRHGPFSECAQGHVSVRPKKGDALLFHSITPAGVLDEFSLHTGCPVLNGTKWTATIWIHSSPYRIEQLEGYKPELPLDPGLCIDTSPNCQVWQSAGECEKNPDYMSTHCTSSCQLCEKCRTNDQACYDRNRERAGYPKIESVL